MYLGYSVLELVKIKFVLFFFLKHEDTANLDKLFLHDQEGEREHKERKQMNGFEKHLTGGCQK